MMMLSQPAYAASAVRITCIAGGIKRVICAAFSQGYKMRDQITLNLCRVDEIGHAKPRCHIALIRVQINANNLICTGKRSLGSRSGQCPKPNTIALLPINLGGVHHRAKARGDPATNVTNFIKWRIRVDFGKRNFRQDRGWQSRAPI